DSVLIYNRTCSAAANVHGCSGSTVNVWLLFAVSRNAERRIVDRDLSRGEARRSGITLASEGQWVQPTAASHSDRTMVMRGRRVGRDTQGGDIADFTDQRSLNGNSIR